MNHYIVWKNLDDTIIIECMSPEYDLQAAQDYAASKIASGVYTNDQLCGVMARDVMPQDRYFRPAWRWFGTDITLDIPACCERHLKKLRRERNKLLDESDALYMKALDTGERLEEIKQYRSALRAMPEEVMATMSSATTPEQIRSIRPSILDTKFV